MHSLDTIVRLNKKTKKNKLSKSTIKQIDKWLKEQQLKQLRSVA